MLEFHGAQDEDFLRAAMHRGEGLLVLGAGASFTSQNQNGANPPLGAELAEIIATHCGQPYQNEPLSEVVEALVGQYISSEQFHRILSNHYSNIEPSAELKDIFNYT
jgi:hypothetical protein